MPQDASCPKCKSAFPVTEARNAFTVACPKCDTEMTVEFKKPAAPPEAGQPHYDLLVKPGALAAAAAPPPKPKKDDDDDDEKRKGGSVAIVIVSGGLGLLFVLGSLSLTAWFLFFFIDTTPSVVANNNTNRPNNNQPNNQPNNQNKGNNNNNNPGPGPIVVPPKPKDTFELKPVRGVQPLISPPSLPDTVSNLDLGSRVGALAVGGGGRYIVMHFPDKGQLGVFDVNAARVTATVPADGGDVQLTAGLSRVVLLASGNIFRVYNLPDLSKQYDNSAPHGVRGMAMGSKTNGPLLTIATFGDVSLWDIGDSGMKEVEGATAKTAAHWHDRCLRAAPDGTAFSTHDGFHGHNKTILLTEQGRKWKTSTDTFAAPFPGVDGNFYGNGVVINKANVDQRYGGVGAGSNTWFLPSVSHKDYFLKLAPQTVGTGVKAKKVLAVSVHKGKNSDVPAQGTTVLSEQPEFEGFADRFRTDPVVIYDQHLFLIPEAKVLVTLNQKRDRLVLRKLDINIK